MNQNPGKLKFAGDGAGVLRPRGAERDEHIIARVIALGDRDRADCLGHVGVGNADEALGQVKVRGEWWVVSGELVGDFVEAGFDSLSIQRKWKMFRHDSTEHEIAIGYGQRSAAAVAGGTRIGAGAVRTDYEFHAVEIANGAAAG